MYASNDHKMISVGQKKVLNYEVDWISINLITYFSCLNGLTSKYLFRHLMAVTFIGKGRLELLHGEVFAPDGFCWVIRKFGVFFPITSDVLQMSRLKGWSRMRRRAITCERSASKNRKAFGSLTGHFNDNPVGGAAVGRFKPRSFINAVLLL